MTKSFGVLKSMKQVRVGYENVVARCGRSELNIHKGGSLISNAKFLEVDWYNGASIEELRWN